MLSPDVGPRNDSRPADTQISRRTSVCKHHDEFIEPRQHDNEEQWHGLIAFASSKEHSRAENRPAHIEAQCTECATEVKDGDDKNQTALPQRTPDSYRAGTSSPYAGGTGITPRGEFHDVLERPKCSRPRDTAAKPNPRVFEEKDQAHRRGVQAKTTSYRSKWLAIPTRRVWGTARHTTGRVESGVHRRSMFPLSRYEDKLI